MSLSITLVRKTPARAKMLAVAVTSDQVDDQPHGLDWGVLASRGFEGKVGQVQVVSGSNGPVAVLGMGEADSIDATAFRRAGVAFIRAAHRDKHIAADVLGLAGDALKPAEAAQAFAEGLELGAYRYTALKSEPKRNEVLSVALVGSGKRLADGVARGQAIAGGVCLARDLVNEPGGSLTPVAFARRAAAVAKSGKLTAKVLGAAEIKKARMGGLLRVNRGSPQQPRFVQLTYKPAGRAKGHVALVGKGITFDSGGLSIKTGTGMMTMKCDMAGAAAVLGAMAVIPALGLPLKVSAYMPLTDNMLGGDATRPGDVLKIRNGKTVEVLNTDAEGRLVLADALVMASDAKPTAIVDLATLTGASVVALGPRYAGVMGTDGDGWVDQVLAASGRTGERVWQLPLPPEYRTLLDSNVADLKNIGGPHGGAITAGIFLQEFVGEDVPWAHIDIAAPAFIDAPFEEHPKGGTGFGVRLLVDLLENFQAPDGNAS
ncbi:MAG: leucyl aminopeptidase [Acidimicrobiales bacterium]